MTYPFSFRHLHNVTYPAGTTVTYTYDPMGNRLNMATIAGNASSTIAYTYDAGDELLSAGTITYTYDNNGNRIGKNEANGTTLYGYDAAGRLASVSLPGSTLLQFTYDGDGNRLGKSVTSGNTTESAQYVWAVSTGLPQLLIESDGQDTAISLYGLQRISMTGTTGEQMYYQYDGLGSVRSLSDISGNTVNTYSYDAFGKPDLVMGSADNIFRFTGEQVDPETGLIYLRARYYDPETGRFISKDPFTGFASVPSSLNRYTYVQNNPVRYNDPSGKVAPVVAAIAAYVGRGAAIGAGIGLISQYYCDYQANTATGKTGMDLYLPSSSLETYGVSIRDYAITGAATAGIFPAGQALSKGIPVLESIVPPTMSYAAGVAGYTKTNLDISSANGKPLDVQAAGRDASLMAGGAGYPWTSPAFWVLKIPRGASILAGPDATNQFWDKSGGASGGKS